MNAHKNNRDKALIFIKNNNCSACPTYDGYSVMGGYSQGEVVFEKSPIKKIGKNKYKVVNSGYRGYTCAIAVKKKTITVKFTSPKGAMKVGKNGTYKLK